MFTIVFSQIDKWRYWHFPGWLHFDCNK